MEVSPNPQIQAFLRRVDKPQFEASSDSLGLFRVGLAPLQLMRSLGSLQAPHKAHGGTDKSLSSWDPRDPDPNDFNVTNEMF